MCSAVDGCLVIWEKLEVIKAGCAKSFAPFPPGNILVIFIKKERVVLKELESDVDFVIGIEKKIGRLYCSIVSFEYPTKKT